MTRWIHVVLIGLAALIAAVLGTRTDRRRLRELHTWTDDMAIDLTQLMREFGVKTAAQRRAEHHSTARAQSEPFPS